MCRALRRYRAISLSGDTTPTLAPLLSVGLKPESRIAIIALAIAHIPIANRITRSASLPMEELAFAKPDRRVGVSPARIILRRIAPCDRDLAPRCNGLRRSVVALPPCRRADANAGAGQRPRRGDGAVVPTAVVVLAANPERGDAPGRPRSAVKRATGANSPGDDAARPG
jgi:hypothetical protein